MKKQIEKKIKGNNALKLMIGVALSLLIVSIFAIISYLLYGFYVNDRVATPIYFKNTEGKNDFFSCGRDSDCVSVKSDCCGCTGGGTAVSINKKFREKWQNNPSCKEIICPAVISNHPSCFQEPKCSNGKCILKNKSSAIDKCSVGAGQRTGATEIFNQDNPDFSNIKSACEQKSDCQWKNLGGKIKRNYTCCPKDLKSIATTEDRKTYERCFVIID